VDPESEEDRQGRGDVGIIEAAEKEENRHEGNVDSRVNAVVGDDNGRIFMRKSIPNDIPSRNVLDQPPTYGSHNTDSEYTPDAGFSNDTCVLAQVNAGKALLTLYHPIDSDV